MKQGTTNRTIWVSLSLLILLGIAYANSFQASWHYDDYANIVNNEKVHLTEWSWGGIHTALTAGHDLQKVSRPLAYLSFALNYLWGGKDVLGYHLVNFIVHWLTAVLLFLLIRKTLTLQVFQGRYALRAGTIAWLAAVFWACHPIQVTAVTYIVQRMTAMAGLFYVGAMYAYAIGRTSRGGRSRWTAYTLVALCGSAAMLCKENAVLLMYALVLYELLFFRKLNRITIGKALLWAVVLSGAVLIIGSFYVDLAQLLTPYPNRPFTMGERVLTQPRVLFIYLGLIAVPMTSRMTILHDLALSHSLLDPWTTLLALSGLLLTIVALGVLAPRHRLFAYCGLFFLLNHALESSILNLELLYEHRNYVPSMFLFVPLATAIVRSYDWFYYRPSFQATITVATAVLLLSAIHTTIDYNRIFRGAYSLWLHNVAIYPNMSLAHNNLGKELWKLGHVEDANAHMREAIRLGRYNNTYQEAFTYYNIGLYEANSRRDFEKALKYFKEADTIFSDSQAIWTQIALMHMQLAEYEAAANTLQNASGKWPKDHMIKQLLAICYVKQKRYQLALDTITQSEASGGIDAATAAMVVAESYRKTGRAQDALNRLVSASQSDPGNRLLILACIEMADEMGRKDQVKRYATRLLAGMSKGASVSLKINIENLIPFVPDTRRLERVLSEFLKGH